MRIPTVIRKSPRTSPASTVPACCLAGLDHCHDTLVLHADGTAECDSAAFCGADDSRHELWVACDELGCGCTGDDNPLEGWLLAA